METISFDPLRRLDKRAHVLQAANDFVYSHYFLQIMRAYLKKLNGRCDDDDWTIPRLLKTLLSSNLSKPKL